MVAGLPQIAQAWGSLILLDAPPKEDTLSIGSSYWQVPRSPDGQHTTYALTPALDYERHDGWFVSTETGVGYNASPSDQWQAGARLWPQFGRARQDATPDLPRIGPRLQAQGFANVKVADVALLQSAVSYGAGLHRDGMQTEVGVTSGIPWTSGLLGVGIAATYANRSFRRDETGVDHAGWTDWSWTLSFDQKLGGRWHADGQLQRATILGALPPLNGPNPQAGWHPTNLLLSIWRDW
jgi:outer membrane scaffolding protein for murein synthesis (MipA/OmpV family)